MIEEEILSFLKNQDMIFCYGAGVYGRIVKSYLVEKGVKVDSFVVSEKDVADITILDIPVRKASELDAIERKGAFLLTLSPKFQNDVISNLNNLGIENYLALDEKIVQIMDEKCSYDTIPKQSGAKILLYHRVSKLKNDIWKLANNPESFKKQMCYLKQNYEIVKFEELDFSEKQNRVAITFDDGYFDNYEYALPILEELRIPAVVFVATGHIGTSKEFWWDELERMIFDNADCPSKINVLGKKYILNSCESKTMACYDLREKILLMDYDSRKEFMKELSCVTGDNGTPRLYNRSLTVNELRRLDASPFITIGGHTVTHTRLTSQTKEQKQWEISQSKKELERLLGHEIDVFSYPFGGYDDYDIETIECVKAAGYKRIAAVQKKYFNTENVEYNPNRIVIQERDGVVFCEREFRRLLILK